MFVKRLGQSAWVVSPVLHILGFVVLTAWILVTTNPSIGLALTASAVLIVQAELFVFLFTDQRKRLRRLQLMYFSGAFFGVSVFLWALLENYWNF